MAQPANLESPSAALRAAVAELGSQSAMGRLLGITQAAVSKWLSKAQPLPAEHVAAVEAATGISRHALRPDIFGPAPTDDPASSFDADRFEAAR